MVTRSIALTLLLSLLSLGGCSSDELAPGVSPVSSEAPDRQSAASLQDAPCLGDADCEQGECSFAEPLCRSAGTSGVRLGEVICEGRCREPSERGARIPEFADVLVPCGPRMCLAAQVCCNASCGICTAPGEACTTQVCGIVPPPVETCGQNVCEVGSYCCNESCGICAPLGGACLQVECDTVR